MSTAAFELAGVAAALAPLGEIVARTPFAYASSWPLDELVVRAKDGGEQRLLLKRLGAEHPAKPSSVCDPAREPAVYRLLAGEDLGTPRCFASGVDWLALELVEGQPLWQARDPSDWAATARAAALLHARFRGARIAATPLRRLDEGVYRAWFERARARRDPVAELTDGFEAAVRRLERLEPTLVHGELYPSNVVIGDRRVALVDWEMAAWGPGVLDLAALITGWDGAARQEIVASFGDVAEHDLAAAALVLAVQWLGWSPGWRPPRSHRRDWLAEARAAAKVLA